MFGEPSFLHGQAYQTPHFNLYNPANHPIYNATYMPVPQNYLCRYDNTNDVSVITSQTRQNDERDIEQFLGEVDECNDITDSEIIRNPSKISISKNALASALQLNRKLRTVCEELKNNENIPENEWREQMEICDTAKQEITNLLKSFDNPEYIARLKTELKRRKKKRMRMKRKKENWKNERLIRKDRRARLHAEIDSWIRKEQAVIDREKQEENLRKDADMILSDVRGKRSDARKFLAILKELKNLRNIKANIAKARGEHLSLAADEAFNNIIEKLTEQWANLDRDYSIEEQGLKLMLKTDNEERIEKQKKSSFDDWENVLFGRKMSDLLHPDMTTFVAIRTAWDKYISSGKDATAIPIGWVIPDKPFSAAWQKCLAKEVS